MMREVARILPEGCGSRVNADGMGVRDAHERDIEDCCLERVDNICVGCARRIASVLRR